MFLSWKHYLRSHPSVGEFNTNSEALQAIFDTSDPAQCFRSLTENRILTCLTRSPMSTEVQASFLHASEKESFQQQKPYSLALMGFGQRAQAVRIGDIRWGVIIIGMEMVWYEILFILVDEALSISLT